MDIIVFDAASPASEDYPRADRLVRGNPRRLTQTCHASADGLVSAGIWTCETGAWNIHFAEGKDEFFCVLEGRVRLHDRHGQSVDIGPGGAAVIPAGFAGCFEVLEPVRKYFVVIDRASANGG